MMKKLTSILAMVIAIAAINGCDSDDPKLNKCLITKVAYSDDDFIEIYYTSDDRISKVASTYTSNGQPATENTTYTYDSKGNIIKTENAYGGLTTYAYDDKNQLTKEEYFYKNELKDRNEYGYNATGQLVKAQDYYINSEGAAVKDNYSEFTYSSTNSKNPTKELMFTSTGSAIKSYEFTFDDKKNVYSAWEAPALTGYAAEENNLTKLVYKNSSGDVLSTTTIIYEYNNEGYPTKATSTSVSSGSTDTWVETYSYNCK